MTNATDSLSQNDTPTNKRPERVIAELLNSGRPPIECRSKKFNMILLLMLKPHFKIYLRVSAFSSRPVCCTPN
jgi:hypothetical protein